MSRIARNRVESPLLAPRHWRRTTLDSKWSAAALALSFTAGAASLADAQVNIAITSDNAYGFGVGTKTGIVGAYGPVLEATLSSQIFSCGTGAETYSIAVPMTNQLFYIVAWSDDAVTQGLLGQFSIGTNPKLYTGIDPSPGAWQVYATGLDYDVPSGGPPLAVGPNAINTQIPIANANGGGASSSIGWVSVTGGGSGVVVFGEDNSLASGNFPIVCGIDSGAQWMWYNSDTVAYPNPFHDDPPDGKGHHEYLIFRIRLTEIPGFPWKVLGGQKIGSSGIAPELVGGGTLEPGSMASLGIEDAAPNSVAVVAVGLQSNPVNLLCGGTLLAFPIDVTLTLPTNGAGQTAMPFAWPAGLPSGLSFTMQAIVADPGASCGVSFTNALQATTP